jgi:hypothetical protein
MGGLIIGLVRTSTIRMYIRTYMYAYIHGMDCTVFEGFRLGSVPCNIHTYIHTYIHACIPLRALGKDACHVTYIHTYIHTYMHAYNRHTCFSRYLNGAYTHTHVYTYIHTCFIEACTRPCHGVHVGVYVYGCMCACVCTHECMHTRAGGSVCVDYYGHTHTYMYACMHKNMHTNIHAYKHTCIQTYMHTDILTYMHTSMHAYKHTCIHGHACIHGPFCSTQIASFWRPFSSTEFGCMRVHMHACAWMHGCMALHMTWS